MAEKKLTKAQKFEDMKNLLNGKPTIYGLTVASACEFIDYEIGLLAKKNSSTSKKETETQKLNSERKELIKNYLRGNGKKTVSEMIKEIPAFATELLSTQRVSRLCNDLVSAGELEKVVEKGKSLFFLSYSDPEMGIEEEAGDSDTEEEVEEEN